MILEIKETFKQLIPPLTSEEYNQLEKNCIAEGIRDKIIVWQNTIIDGHNRYSIAIKHNLNFEILEKEFENENDVIEWIIYNQFGRRNINNYQRSVLALRLENVYKAKAKANQGTRTDIFQKSEKSETIFKGLETKEQIEINPVNSVKEISKIANVSIDTMARVKKIEAVATPEIKAKLQNNEVSINEAYKEIKQIEKQEILETKKLEYIEKSTKEVEIKPIIELMDSIEYLNTFNDNSIDLLFTDPPYSTDIENINEFAESWLNVAIQKIKTNGRCFICIGAYPKEIKAYLDVLLNQNKFIVDNPLIWTYRNTLGITPKMKYNLNYQMILHLYSDTSKELDTSITNEMFSVQDINAPDGRLGNRLHTWQKPDELARRLIRHTTKENDLVVDCFTCTGTFLIEAARLKRIAKGCDISQENLNIAKGRGCIINGL